MAVKATRRSSLRRARATKGRPDWVPSADSAQQEIRRVRAARYRRHRQNVLRFIAVLAMAAGYVAFRLGSELVRVQGSGMSPTLESGSMVLCVKQSVLDALAGIVPEDVRRIGRDDLVLIDYRVEPDGEARKKARSALLIKRAVAMAGDEIDAAGGEIIVNREWTAGSLGSSDLVYPVVVPSGAMYALGDNRALSVDSRQRAFGMVAEADVIARPLAVVWPVYAEGLVK